MGSGFPNRPALGDYGSDIVNTHPVSDPTRELDARYWNLAKFQLAGMGVVTPRVKFTFTSANPAVLLERAEAWNPRALATGAYAPPTVVRNAGGDYTWSYPTQVPDEEGTLYPLSFADAMGWVRDTDDDPTGALFFVRCAVQQTDRNKIRVARLNSSAALAEAGTITVVAW